LSMVPVQSWGGS